MKNFKRTLTFTIMVLVASIIIAFSYITLALPDAGKPELIHIALTPQRIVRGKYLANHVSLCMDCHSQRDWSKPIGEIAADKLGGGGDNFGAELGVPGTIYVPNITPYRLRSWTDGEILRALTTGERKDGSAIYPLMPWPAFSKMDREDLYAIIAYLRTLPAIKTADYPKPVLDFPENILIHTLPRKTDSGHIPLTSDTVNYGAYLVNAASCSFCHSQKKDGKVIAGLDLAGGVGFPMGGKTAYSANLTPDQETGIGNWTREAFVDRFKSFTDSAQKADKKSIAPSLMPWYDYSGMTTTDLKAIYAYLRSLKPIRNKVMSN
jgi:cytochrome c2